MTEKKVARKIDEGIDISSLIKWSKYIPSNMVPFSNQLAFLRLDVQEALYGGGTRGGKACTMLTRVITPFGWKYMKDIEVGDIISNPDGVNCKVIGKYPQGLRPCYKITFQDGRTCIIDEEHLWKVRKSRKTASKKNRNRPEELNYEIMTTKTMLDYLDKTKTQKTKYNLLIPLTTPVQFTRTYKKNMIRIDPYVLGVLIGDGCVTNEEWYSISGLDEEVFKEVELRTGWKLKRRETCAMISKSEEGLTENLKIYGLYGKYSYEKFIPDYYKLSSIEDRTDMMRGLMDTDGYVDSRGHMSYCTTSKQLADDIVWIVRSLGGRANIQEKTPTYKYKGELKKGRLAYIVHFQISNGDKYVNLMRKKERREFQSYMGGITEPTLKIETIEYLGEEETCCITVSHVNGLFLIDDFIVTHNSIALLMAALQYADIPGYNGIIFRKSYTELSKGDGLIPLSMTWLKPWEDEGVKWDSDNKQWKFPSGAIVGFGHLESENDKYKYIGQAYQFIGFDELTQQKQDTYSFLFSRLVRSKEQQGDGIPLRMRSTTNPNGPEVAWVYDRFINKRTRVLIKNEIVRLAKEKGIKDELITDEYIRYRMPIFIPSLARDNPHLDMVSYMDSLDKLDPVIRRQLAEGDWEIREMGNMFSRDWFEKVPYAKVPIFDLKKVRYWDMASTRNGDATASCHLGYDKSTGLFYILDFKILHMTPREVEREIYLCCIDDGPKTTVYMEKEPGSAGNFSIDNFKRKVIPPGWRFVEDRASGDKETRARPVSAASEKEIIKIAWNRTCDSWFNLVMDELEQFPEAAHDDSVDCLAGAFNVLNHGLHEGLSYVGKMDWLLPTIPDDKNPANKKTDDPIMDVIRGRKVNF
jgi:predicted phage terminase large subunit-like protein